MGIYSAVPLLLEEVRMPWACLRTGVRVLPCGLVRDGLCLLASEPGTQLSTQRRSCLDAYSLLTMEVPVPQFAHDGDFRWIVKPDEADPMLDQAT